MKKWLPFMASLLVVFLVACSSSDENSEGEDNMENDKSSNEETNPENIVSLIEQLTFDGQAHQSENGISFDFFITNDSEKPITLGFSSSQKYEIILKNEAGEEVYRYSKDQMFAQQLTTEELEPRGQLAASETIEEDLPPGEYEATMSFLVKTVNDQPLNTKPFVITDTVTIGGEGGEESSPHQGENADASSAEPQYGEVFREMTMSGENGQYSVSGEANVNKGEFYYTIDDGHNIFVEDEPVKVDDPQAEWSPFSLEIELNPDKLPDSGALVMTIYEKDENGEPVNMNYVPLENFDA
ncbi:BsuPI-related putative proteinase inhibitor [Halobacillus sp. Marseille-Q1614]|uniref:BsuPI-related putative proteinase inhibitor n=1 Tax=Halobacillus sp. Marseille-Q1614 TaxID=2709134 RepID=UPI00156F5E2C|nr:BsuPI-related putative proteinase inhibitor [Halobacillus sp. Marseille-Q1614]